MGEIICSYPLKDNGIDEIRIPGNAVAYGGIYYGRIRFYRDLDGTNDVEKLTPVGYWRWMEIISKPAIGGSERQIELL